MSEHNVAAAEAGFERLRLEDAAVPSPLRELAAKINAALSSRQGLGYAEVVLLSVWYEDDADAERDIRSLQGAFSRAVKCDRFMEIMIPAKIVAKHVHRYFFSQLFSESHLGALDGERRGLLAFHYVGHGREQGGSGLFLGPGARRQFSFRDTHNALTKGNLSFDSLDVVYVLDCCAAAAAVREAGTQTIELLAATTTTTSMRNSGISFTQAVSSALQNLRRENAPMAIQSIYQKILFRSMTPVNLLLSGHSTIVLPPKDGQQPSSTPVESGYGALVCIQVPNDSSDDEVTQFCSRIDALPAELHAKVEYMYRTNSRALFVMIPLSLAAAISGPTVKIVLPNACPVALPGENDEDKENKTPTTRSVFREHNK